MPQFPKHHVTFTPERRPGQAALMDMERSHPPRVMGERLSALPDSCVVHVARIDEAIAEEALGKRMFLEALQEMVTQAGGSTNVQQAFNDSARHMISEAPHARVPSVFGSQILLSLHDFPATKLSQKRWNELGPPETTTRYGFYFRFPRVATLSTRGVAQGVATSYYQLDAAPFALLEQCGISLEKRQRFFEEFLFMATMAEHDYLHQLVTPLKGHTPFYDPDETSRVVSEGSQAGRIPDSEKYALGIHAAVCAHLFAAVRPAMTARGAARVDAEGNPVLVPIGRRRKEAVLGHAATFFALLRDMQQEAEVPAGRKQEFKEAITYLAEIYAHRLFRVISPVDPELAHGPAAEAAQALALAVPPKQGKPQPDLHGIEGLNRLCATYLGGLYEQCHARAVFPLVTKALPIGGVRLALETQADSAGGLIDRLIRHGAPAMQQAWEARLARTDDGAEAPGR